MKKRFWVLALPLSWAAYLLIAQLTHGGAAADPLSVPCEEAMGFADQSGLPAGAHDAKCILRGGPDTDYDVRFRIARADLGTWLGAAYPDLQLTSECDRFPKAVDSCGQLDLRPPARGGAVAIEVSVEYRKNETALVHFEPFNT